MGGRLKVKKKERKKKRKKKTIGCSETVDYLHGLIHSYLPGVWCWFVVVEFN